MVPSRDEWERSIPIFRGEYWEVPAEHSLDFHDCIHRLQIVHEDVQIKLFFYSLEGISRDWYRSLPIANIISLEDFHAAFHLFCKGIFSVDLLYPEYCHEFNLLNKELNIHDEYAVVGDTSYCDQDINEFQDDNHIIDAFDIVSNASTDLGCHEDEMVPFGNLKDKEQKGSYQQLSLHFLLTEVEQSTFNININEGKYHQHKKVFPIVFYDPVADYLELISNIDIKIFLSDDSWFRHPLKLHCCMLGFHLFFRSRSRISSAEKLLTWLHWKHDVM